ncbi:hypothetical protein K7X08_015398 [Anisodus acutangulus]|uniref:Uncharacterized protein n=1 Tax=Anisodus acutangulus TaxID=402998 RepID=A0A9Q1L632_9SOLA|nr:hypothetical protein K7X08_015398 [Anisodus acutangulus]
MQFNAGSAQMKNKKMQEARKKNKYKKKKKKKMPKMKNMVMVSAALPQNIARKKRKTIEEREEKQRNEEEDEVKQDALCQPNNENKMEEEIQENSNHKEQILEEDATDKEEHCDYDIDKKEEKEADHDIIDPEQGQENNIGRLEEEEHSDRSFPMEIKNMRAIDLYVELECEQAAQNFQSQNYIQKEEDQLGTEETVESRTESNNNEQYLNSEDNTSRRSRSRIRNRKKKRQKGKGEQEEDKEEQEERKESKTRGESKNRKGDKHNNEKAMARFFWGSSTERRRYHWSSWSTLCSPKEE